MKENFFFYGREGKGKRGKRGHIIILGGRKGGRGRTGGKVRGKTGMHGKKRTEGKSRSALK